MSDLNALGWQVFDPDDRTLKWAKAALPAARSSVSDPANAHWLRCGGTWFVGVDALPNAADGSIAGVPLAGPALDHLKATGDTPPGWHAAQVSVIYLGYPQPGSEETDAAFRFRRDRDAAHVDGLLPIGPNRARMMREPHGFVLGLPLTDADRNASPMTVWTGSHHIIRETFANAFADRPVSDWPDIDLTDVYRTARRKVFETCERHVLHVAPGGSYLVHRMALHGVARWADGAQAAPEGRMIAYFRPQVSLNHWLFSP